MRLDRKETRVTESATAEIVQPRFRDQLVNSAKVRSNRLHRNKAVLVDRINERARSRDLVQARPQVAREKPIEDESAGKHHPGRSEAIVSIDVPEMKLSLVPAARTGHWTAGTIEDLDASAARSELEGNTAALNARPSDRDAHWSRSSLDGSPPLFSRWSRGFSDS
jgi:hypothetical protein